MTVRLAELVVDCRDAYALSTWWKPVLGYTDDPEDPNEPGHELCLIVDPAGGVPILFIEVPEQKAGKNRLHLDVRPTGRTRDEELPGLLAHGATVVADHRQDGGYGWVVLADPEGNEFCLLRSDAEVAAHEAAEQSAATAQDTSPST